MYNMVGYHVIRKIELRYCFPLIEVPWVQYWREIGAPRIYINLSSGQKRAIMTSLVVTRQVLTLIASIVYKGASGKR